MRLIRSFLYAALTCAALIFAQPSVAFTGSGNTALDFYRVEAQRTMPDTRPAKVTRADRLHVSALVTKYAEKKGIPPRFYHQLIKQESGYNPKAVGPPTRWGRAYGPGQMLCSTAAVLGEPDCRVLTRDPERAIALSATYVIEGYRATGSWHGAASYYHGGPNTRLWGPKTRQYAAIVSRGVGSGSTPAWTPFPQLAMLQ